MTFFFRQAGISSARLHFANRPHVTYSTVALERAKPVARSLPGPSTLVYLKCGSESWFAKSLDLLVEKERSTTTTSAFVCCSCEGFTSVSISLFGTEITLLSILNKQMLMKHLEFCMMKWLLFAAATTVRSCWECQASIIRQTSEKRLDWR